MHARGLEIAPTVVTTLAEADCLVLHNDVSISMGDFNRSQAPVSEHLIYDVKTPLMRPPIKFTQPVGCYNNGGGEATLSLALDTGRITDRLGIHVT